MIYQMTINTQTREVLEYGQNPDRHCPDGFTVLDVDGSVTAQLRQPGRNILREDGTTIDVDLSVVQELPVSPPPSVAVLQAGADAIESSAAFTTDQKAVLSSLFSGLITALSPS